jgi:hypothetical protein
MTVCAGTPAELHALKYVEGTLSEFEAERFEAHYFDCPVCLQHLQAIQALALELASHPGTPIQVAQPRIPHAWRTPVWIISAVAASFLIGVVIFKSLESRQVQPTLAQRQPGSQPRAEHPVQPVPPSAQPVIVSLLADLSLPAYSAFNLRGESLDAHFEAGMQEYAKGNCRGALDVLAKIPTESEEARAGQFYSGACQMHLGDFALASELLRKVAYAGNSPQQENAFYMLAQIALAGNDPATAHTYLLRTISLCGDFEERARSQDRKIAKFTGPSKLDEARKPVTK